MCKFLMNNITYASWHLWRIWIWIVWQNRSPVFICITSHHEFRFRCCLLPKLKDNLTLNKKKFLCYKKIICIDTSLGYSRTVPSGQVYFITLEKLFQSVSLAALSSASCRASIESSGEVGTVLLQYTAKNKFLIYIKNQIQAKIILKSVKNSLSILTYTLFSFIKFINPSFVITCCFEYNIMCSIENISMITSIGYIVSMKHYWIQSRYVFSITLSKINQNLAFQ